MSNNTSKTEKADQTENEETVLKDPEQAENCGDTGTAETSAPDQDEEIIRLNREIDTLKDLMQRRQADFENFRKRTLKMQEDNKKLAIRDFACDIINVSDDLNRAIEASENLSGQENPGTKDSFIEGIKLVSKRIEDILNKYGIEEIESENRPFNPNYHEALEIENSSDHIEDTVTKVYQRGFKLDEHLVRSAKVRVSKPAAKKNDAAEDNGKSS